MEYGKHNERNPLSEMRTLFHSAMVASMLTAVLIFIKVMFEHTHYGEQLSYATYDFLQSQLRGARNHVVVIDIAKYARIRPNAASNERTTLTDRKILKQLIEIIAKDAPYAIAIAIDFSPSAASGKLAYYDDENDEQLFTTCVAMHEKGIPVFLGVDEAAIRRPAEWLLKPEFAFMAAGLRKPQHDNKMATAWTDYHASGARLFSIGYRLGTSIEKKAASIPKWLEAFVSDREQYECTGQRANVSDFYVDSSSLIELQKETRTADDVIAGKADFRKRLVLIGAADFDCHLARFVTVAGPTREAFPSIYFHGLAANTIATRTILTPTHTGRIALDALLSIMVIGTSLLIGVVSIKSKKTWHLSANISKTATLATILVSGYVCIYHVNNTGLMWDDYFMVFFALLTHSKAEEFIHRFMHRSNHHK